MYETPQYSGGRKRGPHEPDAQETDPQDSSPPTGGQRADDPLAAGPRKPLPARIRPGNPRPEALAPPAVPAAPAARNALEETGQMPALFTRGRIPYPPPPALVPAGPAGPDFAAIQRSPAFTDLRSRLRSFIFPMSFLFFAWYMTYVLLAAYAHDFMSRKVFGEVNVAILLGLSQFVTTVLITIAYVKFAKRHVDPQVALIREQSSSKDQPGAATR